MTVCIPCFVGFLIAGITSNGFIGLAAGTVVLVIIFAILYAKYRPQKAAK